MKCIDKYYKMLKTAKKIWKNWQRIRWWLILLVGGVAVFVVATWMSRVYFGNGFPYTHDGENHLARFMNYAAALRETQIPPRFAPYLNSGFGFPTFNYNYPLANILAVPVIALGFSPAVAFSVLVWGSAALGTVSTYQVLKRFFSRQATLFGTGWYVASSYWASAVVFRGNIGEILWYAFVPALVLGWLWLQEQQWSNLGSIALIFLTAAAWLAHNVLAVLLMPLLAVWSFSMVWRDKQYTRWFLIWLASVGLVVWFWVPAVMELNLVALTGDDLVTEARGHALTWAQVWWSPLRFGFSRQTHLDTFGFGLGLGSVVITVVALVGKFKDWWQQKKSAVEQRWNHQTRTQWLLGVSFLSALWLATESSSFLWQQMPFLSIVQFPWRFLFIVSLALVVFASWVWERLPVGKWLLVILLLVQIGAVQGLQPVDHRYYPREYYQLFPHTTSTRNENRPETLQADTLGSWERSPQIATGEAKVQVLEWLGSRRSYTVEALTDVIIMETTVYFPGWRTTLDDEKVEYSLHEVEPYGFIAFHVPARPGEPYQVQTAFVERTPWRLLGEVVSGVTGVLLVGLGAYWLYRFWKERRGA